MKRQLIALIVMLVIGLQGSVMAFAHVAPMMSGDCQTVSSQSGESQDSCCPKGHHSMSCCLDACVGTVAGPLLVPSQTLAWIAPDALIVPFISTPFSSRGDSPLIRPPIS